MDKGLGSDNNGGSSSGSSNRGEMFLKHLNKNSHRIVKPVRKSLPPQAVAAAAAAVAASSSAMQILDSNSGNSGSQSQQPPVYNINKNDFRDVVQKLTGSPAHERHPTPPPPPPTAVVTYPRPSSSRLQRIRPPPLVQIGNRPPQLNQLLPRPSVDCVQRGVTAVSEPAHGLSFAPLPPLPSVHTAAESPISAYMRFLQSSGASPGPSPLWNGVAAPIGARPDSVLPQNEFGQRAPPPPPAAAAESPISAYVRFLQNPYHSSAPSPRGNVLAPQLPPPNSSVVGPQHPLPRMPPSSAWTSPFSALPMSPLPFGCAPSPRSPYGMMSPSFLFSPTGQLGLTQLPPPLSPTLPFPSPRWKGM